MPVLLRLFSAAILISVAAVCQAADSGVDRLKSFNQSTRSYQAKFEQRIVDEKQKLLEKAGGTMYLQRPGKFRWVYTEPYEQLIVCDGAKIWLYDKDLEQVTVKTMNQGLGDTPALLLTNQRALDEDFLVKDLGVRENLLWVELKPKSGNFNFETIYLAFDQKSLRTMELVDKLGQTTRIQMDEVSVNPVLAEPLFQFTPPADADVVGADG